MRTYVFGLGLSRTGTRSLARALKRLGFSVAHYPDDRQTYADFRHRRPPRILDYRDGIIDLPAPTHFSWLAELYPSSRFIVTLRPVEQWLESMRVHLGKLNLDLPNLPPDRQEFARWACSRAYGGTSFDEDRLRRQWYEHCEVVQSHFERAPERLLTLDLFRRSGWADLCDFFQVAIPTEPFPHVR